MRNDALQLQKGSYKPCPPGESRRVQLAIQHIYEGYNTFPLLRVRGPAAVSNNWSNDAVLLVKDEMLVFKPFAQLHLKVYEFLYDDIEDWRTEDVEHLRSSDSFVEITLRDGTSFQFYVAHIRDLKHTVEYFWNQYQVSMGRAVKLGSTHGRPIVTVTTLSGELPAPESPVGSSEVVDQDGLVVRPGGRISRPQSTSVLGGSKGPSLVPPDNKDVKKHWHRVVKHQGWLLKKGGIGVGSAKQWIKRYFVLYATSQGHFLVYYSDFLECPMFSVDRAQRNVVDLATATFIRPGSNKSAYPDTPPHSFDIVTTEREWTLCAETQENVQRWLKLLTRAVDEDVAIVPDEDLVFKVKPKIDPLGNLPSKEYSTSLKVSSNGISVTTPDNKAEREHYFWVYTDFYKWSMLSQGGKLALLVNVFADSSFSRRHEYIFRTMDASRLATAIEFFIEKFMSVMHIRLELVEGAMDPQEAVDQQQQGGMHHAAQQEWDEPPSPDLLAFAEDSPAPVAAAPSSSAPAGNSFASNDPFASDDPFAEPLPAPPAAAQPPPAAPATQTFNKPTPRSSVSRAAPELDLISMDAPAAAAPKAAAASSLLDLLSLDDPVAAPTAGLTPKQQEQHAAWRRHSLMKMGGPLFDDERLQIACQVEVRGSQGRILLHIRNCCGAVLQDFSLSVLDDEGLLRHQLSPGPSELTASQQAQQQLMMECMKPVAGVPTLRIQYRHATTRVSHSASVLLPISMATFNEAMPLPAPEFMAKWEQLVAPGLQEQQVLSRGATIVPEEILLGLTALLRFSYVRGVPGESEFVLHGAASLKTGATTPAGDKINLGCLVKIEMNVQSSALRITVRTMHPAASLALMATIKAALV